VLGLFSLTLYPRWGGEKPEVAMTLQVARFICLAK